MIHVLRSQIIVVKTKYGTVLALDEGLRKSFSAEIQQKHPGGRWITINDDSSPLNHRHLYILPHKDGTASVLIGGGSSLRHKTLSLKRDKGEDVADRPGGETATGSSEKEATPAKEEKKKPELSEDQKKQAESHINELSQQIKDKKSALYGFIQEKTGVSRELTPEEKTRIEKRTQAIADPVQRAVEERIETKRILNEKDQAIQSIVKQAKAALLEEEPAAQGSKGIATVVKEHAEELVGMHMAVRALEKERADIRKLVRVGKASEKFRAGHDVMASFKPLSGDDIRKAVADEHALAKELEAHYNLMRTTRGVEGVEDAKGDARMEGNIRQGGFETATGFIGQHTGKAILTKKVYDALGSQNAAILTRHYLVSAGHDLKQVTRDLENYLTGESNPVAFQANERGQYFMGLADKVRQFGLGSDNIMTMAQATGTSLKYMNKAYEAYGQAEGALNQGAELLYALKNRSSEAIEFHGSHADSLEQKRKALGLRSKDVTIKKGKEGGYTMTVPPRSFDRMIREEGTKAHGEGIGLEHTAAEVKEGKANTDDFHPSGINAYTPPDKNGVRQKIFFNDEEQAGLRLLAKQKKVFWNWEAGTGKSKGAIAAKAHLEDVTGKPVKMIVAMPAKLLPNFRDEVAKFSNYKVVMVNDQTPAKRRELYNSDPNTIVLVNKEKMNFDKAAINAAGFDLVVADEAHKITQREGRGKSQMSRGLAEAGSQAPYYIAMSGTPAPDDLSQIYFHANIMNPERFSSQKEFMHLFGSVHKGAGYKAQVQGFMEQYLGDYIHTRKKKARTYDFNLHTHEVELHPAQRKAYKEATDAFRRKEIVTFQRDQRLNSVLNATDHKINPKFAQAKKIIDQHLATKAADEKVLFYAKNRETVDQINSFLSQHYPEFDRVEFTGATKKSELDANKQRYKHDPKVKFSIHMRAGVEGLNLQYDGNGGGGTTAIAIASGEDSYAPLDQFFSRADRTGAKKNVDAHLILTNTPHDIGTQLRLQEKKAIGDLVGKERAIRKSLYLLARR